MIIQSAPDSLIAWHAFEVAKALLQQSHAVTVFFYNDAVQIANQLNWLPQDQKKIAAAWQSLDIDLAVCVSAALARGVTDQENQQRHQLQSNNLNSGFRLTGLGELAHFSINADRIVQF